MSLPELPPADAADAEWEQLADTHGWLSALRGVEQNPDYHGEGDVWTHTRMVVEAIVSNSRWAVLPEPDQRILLWAALLHDVGKPKCTRIEAGRASSPGHARRGEIMARRILWELGAGFSEREHVARLVRAHQLPFWALERESPERIPIRLSQLLRCDLLAVLAEADVRGRIASDTNRLLDNVELFRELCREQDCYDRRYPFANDHSRFVYFRHEQGSPRYEAFDDTEFEVTLLSGLPAAGKDTWITANAGGLPVVSLDDLREASGADPTDRQGAIVNTARGMARGYLRERQPFVWNATNISSKLRAPLVELFAGYRARVKIVYCEASSGELDRRNGARAAPVPRQAREKMLARWEVPTLLECHALEVVLSG